MTPEGTFLDVRTIGRFCYEDDLLTLSAVYTEAQAESQPGFPRLYTDKTINSLKHRLLVYLWRRAEQDGSATAKRRYANTPLFFSLSEMQTSLEKEKLSLHVSASQGQDCFIDISFKIHRILHAAAIFK